MTWTGSGCRSSPGSPPILTGTTCSGIPGFGDVPRYATAAGARRATEARERAQAMAAESASDIPLELVALVTPLPADGGPVPGEIIEHRAHAVGHAAVLLADRGVLLAGDMLSDVLIPLLDVGQASRSAPTRRRSTACDGRRAGRCRGPRPRRRRPRSRGGGPARRRPRLHRRAAPRRGAGRRASGAARTGWPAPTGRTWSRPERH